MLFSWRLLTRDGALLAYSGFESKDAKIIAAMASSIFAAHQRPRAAGTPAANLSSPTQNIVGSGDLNMILLDAEVSGRSTRQDFEWSTHLGRENGHRRRRHSAGLHGVEARCAIRNAQSESKSLANDRTMRCKDVWIV